MLKEYRKIFDGFGLGFFLIFYFSKFNIFLSADLKDKRLAKLIQANTLQIIGFWIWNLEVYIAERLYPNKIPGVQRTVYIYTYIYIYTHTPLSEN